MPIPRADDDAMGNDGTDVCTTSDPSMPALDALVWHASDAAVKPIVANRRIERLPEPKFEPKALQFPAMSLQVCVWGGVRVCVCVFVRACCSGVGCRRIVGLCMCVCASVLVTV